MKQTDNIRIPQKERNEKTLLRVFCYTPIAKPLNQTSTTSQSSHLLRLAELPYTFLPNKRKNKGKREESYTVPYFLRGIKGILRRKIIAICHEAGIEVCNFQQEKETGQNRTVVPEGFHSLSSCMMQDKECLLHQIFGSTLQEGIISVYADPIVSIKHSNPTVPEPVQNVYISTENRVALTYDRKVACEFSERYFSGYFNFTINVSQCTKSQLGLLINGVINFDRLGRGYRSGYGRVEVKALELVKEQVAVNLIQNVNGSFQLLKKTISKSLPCLFQEALEAWGNGSKE